MEIYVNSGHPIAAVPYFHQSNLHFKRKLWGWCYSYWIHQFILDKMHILSYRWYSSYGHPLLSCQLLYMPQTSLKRKVLATDLIIPISIVYQYPPQKKEPWTINPQCACARRVTAVVLCVCVCILLSCAFRCPVRGIGGYSTEDEVKLKSCFL